MELGKILIWSLLGGMGLLLYGMYIMSEGLQKIAGHRLRNILSTLTHNRFTALLVGAIITIFFQSSTATTVILVGLTSASIMTLQQTLGVILGTGIGTTVTAQLIALKVTEIALPIVGIGALIVFFSKQDHIKQIGQVLIGFGLIFLGLKIMSDSLTPLKDEPFFHQMLMSASDYPLLAIAAAALFTFLVHSSAATLGVIMVISMQGLLSLDSAIYLILGANIGTCFTAVISSLGSSIDAKRVALAHLSFKTVGVLLLFPFVGPYAHLMENITSVPGYQVANAHMFFNVGIAFIFLPFINQCVIMLQKILPDRRSSKEKQLTTKYLDDKIVQTPAIAIGLVTKEMDNAADQVYMMIHPIMNVLDKNDIKLLNKINQREDYLDLLSKAMTGYLTKILRQPLSQKEFNRCMGKMHIVADLEHIGDIIEKDITYLANTKIAHNCQFSDEGWKEITEMHQRVVDLMRAANVALAATDIDLAAQVIQEYPSLVSMEKHLRAQHFKRLKDGTSRSVATSSLHLDLINAFLRISEHISNICHEIINQGSDTDYTIKSHHLDAGIENLE